MIQFFVTNEMVIQCSHLKKRWYYRPKKIHQSANNTGVDKSPINEPKLNGASPMKLHHGSNAGIKKN